MTLTVLCVGIGVGIAFSTNFELGWVPLAALPLMVLIAGSVVSIFTYPRRSTLYDQYRPGAEIRVATQDGKVIFSLNGQVIVYPFDDVKRVWAFGKLAAIQFRDLRAVVLPADFVPHTTSGAPQMVKGWGQSAERPDAD